MWWSNASTLRPNNCCEQAITLTTRIAGEMAMLRQLRNIKALIGVRPHQNRLAITKAGQSIQVALNNHMDPRFIRVCELSPIN